MNKDIEKKRNKEIKEIQEQRNRADTRIKTKNENSNANNFKNRRELKGRGKICKEEEQSKVEGNHDSFERIEKMKINELRRMMVKQAE